ncbi:MAG: hypothetical protein JWM98_1056 [Thermoleophilia bacterium]|nr:hypothetical protein [Thermoleophilia bacterium]
MPSWVLPLVVVGALAGAGWLFLADGGGSSGSGHRAAPSKASPKREQAEGELSVPEGDSADSGAQRRAAAGQGRIEGDDAADAPSDGTGTDADTDAETGAATASLPPVTASLAGRRIALAPASASTATGTAAGALRKVGALRLPCASARDAARLPIELALLDRVAVLLRRADATVVRVDDAAHAVPCVDVRVRVLESAELGVVLRADPGGGGRVFAARSDRGGKVPAPAGATSLATELGGALRLGGVDAATVPAVRTLLGRAGAVDRVGGGDTALLEVGIAADASPAALDAVALDIVRGLATAAAARS